MIISKSDLTIYSRLLGYAMPYWKVAAVSVIAMLCAAAMEPLIASLMQPLIDKSLIAKNSTSIWQIPFFIFLAFTTKGLADYVSSVCSQYVAQRTMEDLRRVVFMHEIYLPMSAHQSEDSGRMLSRITYDTAMVGEAVSQAWIVIIRDSLIILGLFAFLIVTTWQLTMVVLGFVPIVAIALRYAGRKLRASNERVQSWIAKLTGLISESLLGLREIKIFDSYSSQDSKFSKVNAALRHEQMKITRVHALNVPIVQVLAATAVSLVIFAASKMSASDLLSPGEFVAFITAMSMIFEPMRRLTNVNAVLQKGLAGAQSIFQLLDRPTESQPRLSSRVLLPLSSVDRGGRVELRNVYYKYPNQGRDCLSNFSLIVEAGESAAIIGASGIGKSTVLHLIAGFDRPTAGEIYIDKRSVDEWGLSEWRKNISFVGQNVALFDGTIEENIRIGNVNAELSEVIRAAKAAHAWEFILTLSKGLETPLGSLGGALSGGQKQRIALARAFLKDAPILLLDEATNALDKSSEAIVLEGIRTLMEGRTTIMVSHHPDRLLRVDRVIEL